jgi:hypothetical protein
MNSTSLEETREWLKTLAPQKPEGPLGRNIPPIPKKDNGPDENRKHMTDEDIAL